MKTRNLLGLSAFLIIIIASLTLLFIGQGNGYEKDLPEEKLKAIFPEADQFTTMEKTLSPEQVQKIEEKLGEKLGGEDKTPVFYIAKKGEKPLGLAFFTNSKGPKGVIHSGIALDLKGKIAKVVLYDTKISEEGFLDQFIGKGIEDPFQVGEDIQPLPDDEETSRAISLLPKKALYIGFALLLKEDRPPEEMKVGQDDRDRLDGEPENLSELMHLIQEQYFVLRDYFKEQEAGSEEQETSLSGKTRITEKDAVFASQKLLEYIGKIPDFEPSKNKKKKKEFLLIQRQIHEASKELVKRIKEGEMEVAKRTFEDILMFVEMAHKRFSEEPIDIDQIEQETEE